MTTYVSNRNGGETDEQGHYRFQTKVWLGNVLSGLAVTENSPLARNVLVPAGDLKIDYGQYAFTAWNDATATVALGTADTTNPRIDRIIAYIDLAVALGTTNNPGVLKFTAVAGTPAGSPTKASDAAVNTAVGATNPWCEIATVRVEANATTIPNSKITDTRVMVTAYTNTVNTAAIQTDAVTDAKVADGIDTNHLFNSAKCNVSRVAAQAISAGGAERVDFDTEAYDTGNNFDAATNHRYVAPIAGFYDILTQVSVSATVNGEGYVIHIYKNGVAVRSATDYAHTGSLTLRNGALSMQLAAGDYIEVYVFNSTGVPRALTGSTLDVALSSRT